MRGAMESADILSRIDELLGLGNANTSLNAPELSQGCVSLLSLCMDRRVLKSNSSTLLLRISQKKKLASVTKTNRLWSLLKAL
jgi:hypothetical protein